MVNIDKEQFSTALVEASFVFTKDITNPMLKIYFELLQDLDINDIHRAIKKHCKIGQFYPKPADIRNIINAGKPTVEDKATLAWLDITSAIGKLGPYRSLTLNDRLALKIVKHVGGWSNLCNLSYKELDFKKREFIEAYKTTASVDQKELPKSLAGVSNVMRLENRGES